MISKLSHSIRQLVGTLNFKARRRLLPRYGQQPVQVELLEQRQLLTAGDLDLTFGVGGHVETEYATSREATKAFASAVQSDGKFIVLGEGGIARFLPNGSLDATFGVDGRISYPYFALSIAIQANGSFIVAGGTTSVNSTDFVVSRYLSNGTVDTSFDTDGHAQVSFGGANEYANDVAIQANGRLVVVGVSDDQIAVTRLTAAGALDTTFSGDGLLLKTIYSVRSHANNVLIQPDGKIVVAGSTMSYALSGSIHDLFVMRLNPSGRIDSSFDVDGVSTIGGGRMAIAQDLTLLSNGQIVISGWSGVNFQSHVVVGRINADGSRDTTFGYEGRTSAFLSSSTSDRIGGEAHVVQADGSIVVSAGTRLIKVNANGVLETSASRSVLATNIEDMISLPDDRLFLAGSILNRFGTAMLKADRTLDTTWSVDGLAPVEFGNSDDIAGRSVQQTNGRILVASTSTNTFAVTRYLSTGMLDTTFSTDGKVTIDFGAQYLKAVANDISVQSDGRIVVVGSIWQVEGISQSSVEDHVAIARLNADGSLDTTFGTNGTVVTRLGGSGRATTVKIQPNGRIVVGGIGNGGYFTMLRYLSNGTLDNSFSGDGMLTTFSSTVASSILNDLVIQPDGKLLVAGELRLSTYSRYPVALLLARFNSNGTTDTTFGTNGRVITNFMQQRTGQRLSLLPDGSFYVGGNEVTHVSFSFSSQMALSRFTSTGQLVFQKVISPFLQNYSANPTSIYSLNSELSSILVQPDGRVVMSGSAGNLLGIVRLNSDGTEDTSFGGDGRSQLSVPATGRYFGTDVIRQANGRLVMLGSFRANGSSRSNLLLSRLHAAGPAGPSTTVFVAPNGQIEIRDNWTRDDSLRLQVVGTNLQVQDLTGDSLATFSVSGLPEVTGAGTKTVLIPLSRIQQTNLPILLNTRAGDDTVTLISESSDAGPLSINFAAGLGADKLIQTSNTVGMIWNLNSAGSGSVNSVGTGTPRTFSSVEHFVGGPLNDEFRVQAGTTSTWMVIDGFAGGNDLIQITGNADMKLTNTLAEIRGGINQNITTANFERATLNGGASANLLDAFFFTGDVTARGGEGNDRIFVGNSGNHILRGDAGDDVLIGGALNDLLFGGSGNDMLIGANGNDQLFGEAGRDILEGGSGNDILRGGSGEDLLISGSAYALQFYYGGDMERDAIRAAWFDTTLTYEQRIVKIRDTGVGTSAPLIRLTPAYSVFTDRDFDQLFGDGDRDWFFATTAGPGSLDLFPDRQLTEELTLLN